MRWWGWGLVSRLPTTARTFSTCSLAGTLPSVSGSVPSSISNHSRMYIHVMYICTVCRKEQFHHLASPSHSVSLYHCTTHILMLQLCTQHSSFLYIHIMSHALAHNNYDFLQICAIFLVGFVILNAVIKKHILHTYYLICSA